MSILYHKKLVRVFFILAEFFRDRNDILEISNIFEKNIKIIILAG